jgi:hypothetical protein
MEGRDIWRLFSDCTTSRFDFYESGSGDMRKIDGADFDILFDNPEFPPSKVLLSSDMSDRTPKSTIKVAVRFPRGPCSNGFNELDWSTIHITTTMREHLTCLQHAANCKFDWRRKIMIRSAIPICNPLVEDSCGRSAAQIMEKTLAEVVASNLRPPRVRDPNTPPWEVPLVFKSPSKTDGHLLERMKKDQDAMLAYLNLGVGVDDKQPSVETEPDLPVVKNDKKRKKGKNKKPRISPFHQIPVDVCRIIHSFVAAN